jgi:ribosome-binding protein aMBF1 (putative translation factor)
MAITLHRRRHRIEDRIPLPLPPLAKQIRRQGGLSARRLARRIGVVRSTIQRWERGTATPVNRVLRARYQRQLAELLFRHETLPVLPVQEEAVA